MARFRPSSGAPSSPRNATFWGAFRPTGGSSPRSPRPSLRKRKHRLPAQAFDAIIELESGRGELDEARDDSWLDVVSQAPAVSRIHLSGPVPDIDEFLSAPRDEITDLVETHLQDMQEAALEDGEAFKQAGLAAVRAEQFRDALIDRIVGTASRILL